MLIKVTVFPESQEDSVVEISKENFEVYVRASAQNGHANKMVSYLLAKHFGKGVSLLSGGMRSKKVFRVND